jgi:hypothetical protein
MQGVGSDGASHAPVAKHVHRQSSNGNGLASKSMNPPTLQGMSIYIYIYTKIKIYIYT